MAESLGLKINFDKDTLRTLAQISECLRVISKQPTADKETLISIEEKLSLIVDKVKFTMEKVGNIKIKPFITQGGWSLEAVLQNCKSVLNLSKGEA